MTDAAVAADFDKALDVQRNFAAKIAFHLDIVVDILSELVDVRFGEIAHARIGVHAACGNDITRGFAADAINIGQANLHALVSGQVYTRNTCHMGSTPPEKIALLLMYQSRRIARQRRPCQPHRTGSFHLNLCKVHTSGLFCELAIVKFDVTRQI